jgi:hypothetical protein
MPKRFRCPFKVTRFQKQATRGTHRKKTVGLRAFTTAIVIKRNAPEPTCTNRTPGDVPHEAVSQLHVNELHNPGNQANVTGGGSQTKTQHLRFHLARHRSWNESTPSHQASNGRNARRETAKRPNNENRKPLETKLTVPRHSAIGDLGRRFLPHQCCKMRYIVAEIAV